MAVIVRIVIVSQKLKVLSTTDIDEIYFIGFWTMNLASISIDISYIALTTSHSHNELILDIFGRMP